MDEISQMMPRKDMATPYSSWVSNCDFFALATVATPSIGKEMGIKTAILRFALPPPTTTFDPRAMAVTRYQRHSPFEYQWSLDLPSHPHAGAD
jgi:hypothetical protein